MIAEQRGRVLLDVGDDPLLHLARDFRIALVVDARDLLVAVRDDAHLRRRRTGPSPTNDGAIPASRHAWASVAAASSRPVTATSVACAAERHDVARHVGGAADAVHVVVEGDDRDRRLRRDARHAADDELVDHRVADDEDVDAAGAREDLARAIRREGWQQHRRGGRRRTEG